MPLDLKTFEEGVRDYCVRSGDAPPKSKRVSKLPPTGGQIRRSEAATLHKQGANWAAG
jgi:hypothetical protein